MPIKRALFAWIVVLVVGVCPTAFGQLADPETTFKQTILPFMAKNCFVCHGEQRQSAGLTLAPLNNLDTVHKDRSTWKEVLQMIENGSMPPKTMAARLVPAGGLPNPTEAERQAIVKWIKGEFDRLDKTLKADAGRVTARRLNRAEYNNTIQDLLGIKLWPADEFPQDDSSHGFDNVADSLSVSPVLMEKYLKAADRAARTALFGHEAYPVSLKRLEQLERAVLDRTEIPKEYDVTGMNNDRALHAIYRFPVDGVYLFRVTSRGFRPLDSEPLELGLWLDGKLVTELKVDPKQDGPSLLGGRQDLFGKPQDYKMFVTAGDHWVAATVLRMFEGLPPVYNGPNPSKRIPTTQVVTIQETPGNVNADFRELAAAATRPATQAAPDANANRGNQQVAAADQVAPATQPGERGRGGRRGGRRGGGGGRGPRLAPVDSQIGIDYVDIIGPYEQASGQATPSAQLIFGPGDFDRKTPGAGRAVIAKFLPRAFRRPVEPVEIDRYVKVFDMVRGQGDSFEEALAVTFQAIMVSPDFLFRIEKDPPAGSTEAQEITEHELATRLSYFLWSTMPDAELTAAADNGTLRKPEVLQVQVQRMLKDKRSHALVENFGGQWLRFRALESSTPDFKLFPEFDEHLRMSMREETEHFFDYIVQNDRSILDFIEGKYTFLNERLSMFYGIGNVKGTEFVKVDLTDTPRGGVFTQASVLTVSSYATRTSPVIRGKWILENMLNAPPPAPPDNVPDLEETIKNNPNATLRQQLEMHRANPTCAGCHSRMDPLGMGLENFNAIGAWRTQDGQLPVDSSGTLPDGRSFSGPVELRNILMGDKDAFAECVAEKLLIYAIGRGVEGYDRPTIKQISTNIAQNDYRFSSLVLEIVKSLPFQKRKGSTP